MRISDWSSDVCSSDLERGKGDGSGGVLLPNFFRRIAMTLPLLRLAEIPDTAARENAERLYGVARALRDRLAVPQSVTRSLLKRLMTEAFGGSDAIVPADLFAQRSRNEGSDDHRHVERDITDLESHRAAKITR